MPRRHSVVLSLLAGVTSLLIAGAGSGTGCSKDAARSPGAPAPAGGSGRSGSSGSSGSSSADSGRSAGSAGSASSALPAHRRYETLAQALQASIPADARVIGFGELHARTDRAAVRSALAAFTEALPAFGARISDLVVETWIVDPKCGQQAVATTQKIETDVKRPAATKSEITLLADAARAAKIQPHAMTLSCKDYERLAPGKGPPDTVAMLGLVTRELARISTSAVAFRDKQPGHRPWIAIYGGALHNDRFPSKAVAEWSYAEAVDLASSGHFFEVDLIVPEFAEPDKPSQAQPWFPLVAAADRVLVWERGERSIVVILPRTSSVTQ